MTGRAYLMDNHKMRLLTNDEMVHYMKHAYMLMYHKISDGPMSPLTFSLSTEPTTTATQKIKNKFKNVFDRKKKSKATPTMPADCHAQSADVRHKEKTQ